MPTEEMKATPTFNVKYYNKRANGIVKRLDITLKNKAIVMLATKGELFEYFVNDSCNVSDLKIIKAIHNGISKQYGEKKITVSLPAQPALIATLGTEVPEDEFTNGSPKVRATVDMKKIVKDHVLELHSKQQLSAEVIASTAFVSAHYTVDEVAELIENYKLEQMKVDIPVEPAVIEPTTTTEATLNGTPVVVDSNGIRADLPF